MTRILGIIPARYASTRFPAKPLVDIQGKTMIRRVYEQCIQANSLVDVVVATDDARIYEHVGAFGGKVVMTSTEHPSGTDRCNEAYKVHGVLADFIINIQGDEPFIKPQQIDLLSSVLTDQVQLATLAIKFKSTESIQNPNSVKIVLNNNGEALYFSRHPIPFVRSKPSELWLESYPYLRHIGIYAYRTDVLAQITTLKPSSLEIAESLEQLRWLENGYKIHVKETEFDSHSIDAPEDIERVLQTLK